MENIATLKNVTIDYKLKKYDIRAVTNVDFSIKKGKITALVGESGSGKTTLASAIIGCISEPGEITNGDIIFNDDEKELTLSSLDKEEYRKFRWSKVSMVFQAAQSALNPVMRIFDQFIETAKDHGFTDIVKIREKCIELFEYVKLDPLRVMRAYPHELSGGMKQRVMIAFSLLLSPKLIILDEPTTALDVITQDYIFNILKKINRDFGISMLLLTHDIGVVAKYSDYVGVMYAGRIMEYGTTVEVFKHTLHPYTKGLINATPSIASLIDTMEPIEGTPPDLRDLPSGCKFAPRCKYRIKECDDSEPGDYFVDKHCAKCFVKNIWSKK